MAEQRRKIDPLTKIFKILVNEYGVEKAIIIHTKITNELQS